MPAGNGIELRCLKITNLNGVSAALNGCDRCVFKGSSEGGRLYVSVNDQNMHRTVTSRICWRTESHFPITLTRRHRV